jgi:hypothetical protein
MTIMGISKFGALLAGAVFLLLSLIMFYLLFIEGMWEGTEFDWLGLACGILMFGLSLWVIRDTVSRRPGEQLAPTPTPLIDEWIGERGLEAIEIEQWRHQSDEGEELLAIIAAWGDQPVNRLAVTTRRLVLYPQNRIPDGVTLSYPQLAAIEQTQHRFLQHLVDITLTLTDGRVLTFENAGKEYAEKVVALITPRQQTHPTNSRQDRPVAYCTQCGTPLNPTDQFCGECGARR